MSRGLMVWDLISVPLVDAPLIGLEGGLIRRIVRAVSRRGPKVHATQVSYDRVLTRLVTSGPEPQPLFISIGEGEWARSWLIRVFANCAKDGRRVMISRIIIKRLSDDLARRLLDAQLIQPGFNEGMLRTIEALRQDPEIQEQAIAVEERLWQTLPPFHGYLFGDSLLIGAWETDRAGYCHVRTSLLETRQSQHPARHAFARSAFEQDWRPASVGEV